MKDELAAARAVLKKHSTMLLTASKVIHMAEERPPARPALTARFRP